MCVVTAFQMSSGGRVNGSMWAVCELVRQLCRWCPEGATTAFVQWLTSAAPPAPAAPASPTSPTAPNAPPAPPAPPARYQPPSAALTHTLAEVRYYKRSILCNTRQNFYTRSIFVHLWCL